MLTKTIEYTNFNDEKKVLVAHFHLGKADMARIAAAPQFLQEMNQASRNQDTATMLAKIEELVRLSYGVRSEDGERFIKNKQVQDEFIQSAAYEEFLMDLLTGDGKSFSQFIKGVFPPALMEMVKKQIKSGEIKGVEKETIDVISDFFEEPPNPESNKGTPAEPTYAAQAKAQEDMFNIADEEKQVTYSELTEAQQEIVELKAKLAKLEASEQLPRL